MKPPFPAIRSIASGLEKSKWASCFSLLATLSALFPTLASAQDEWTANSGAGTPYWTTAGNWSAGVPGTGESIVYDEVPFYAITGNYVYSYLNNQVDESFGDPGDSFSVDSITETSSWNGGYYNILTINNGNLTITGSGITNYAGPALSFDVNSGFSLTLNNAASCSGDIQISADGSSSTGVQGGVATFNEATNAGTDLLTASGSTTSGAGGGTIGFYDSSSAGSATIYANGVNGAGEGGQTFFTGTATAATATLNIEGGSAGGSTNGSAFFEDNSTAGSAVINIFAGLDDSLNGAGTVYFDSSASGGTAQVNNSGILDISGSNSGSGVSFGSISGSGTFELGAKILTEGSLNTSTTVSGTIVDGGSNSGTGGSLNKVGTGTLTLTGTNTYTGGTAIRGGALLANGASSTGTGYVTVMNGGSLGGSGTITTSGVTAGDAVLVQNGGAINQSLVTGGTGTSLLTLALHANSTVNLAPGATFAFDLGASGTNDEVQITGGNLTLHGQNFADFTFNALPSFTGAGVYDLFLTDAPGDIIGALGTTTGTVDGDPATLSVSNGQAVVLTVSTVPEPSTWALLLGGLTLLAWGYRRRTS
jgi:hypothetical protein